MKAAADMLFWVEAAAPSIESSPRAIWPDRDRSAVRARAWRPSKHTARTMALEMEYGFLFDPDRKLLSIGYRVAEGTLDPSCYDLLASEARLASFIAIAKGDVPARHWFRLGRTVTPIAKRRRADLMVRIDVRIPDALAGHARPGGEPARANQPADRAAADRLGAALGLPWGVSESAYNVRDLEMTYQYSNFGVPGLGLKRGLGESAVVAPYATALAAMVDPRAAVRNFARLAGIGA